MFDPKELQKYKDGRDEKIFSWKIRKACTFDSISQSIEKESTKNRQNEDPSNNFCQGHLDHYLGLYFSDHINVSSEMSHHDQEIGNKAFYMICCIYIANHITKGQIQEFLMSVDNPPRQNPTNTPQNETDKISQKVSHPEKENEKHTIPGTWISNISNRSSADQKKINEWVATHQSVDETTDASPEITVGHSTGETEASPETATNPNSEYVNFICELSKVMNYYGNNELGSNSFSVFMKTYTEVVSSHEKYKPFYAQIKKHSTAAQAFDEVKKMGKCEEETASSGDEI